MLGINATGKVELNATSNYEIEVKTANELGSGTDAKVIISLHGKKGDILDKELTKPVSNKDPFEANSLDLFNFTDKHIGKLTKINIGHNGKGVGSAWKLDYVKVIIDKKYTYMYKANRWLDDEKGDKKTRIDLFSDEINDTNHAVAPSDDSKPLISTNTVNAVAKTVNNSIDTTNTKVNNANNNVINATNNAVTTVNNVDLQKLANNVMGKFDVQQIERIKRKFNLISNNGSTIATQDAILLVRSIGENPTNKEFKHELEESKLHNKERLDLKDCMIILEKMYKNEPKSDQEKNLTKAFKKFDKNNDGLIDLEHFKEKMTKTGEKLTSDEFKDLISHINIKRDGKIDMNEFIRLFAQQ